MSLLIFLLMLATTAGMNREERRAFRRPRRVNITQAAEYAGCSERTMRNLVAANKVPVYRLGPKTIRVDLDELDELMRSGVLGVA